MTDPTPLLHLENVSRNFGAFQAVSNVSESFGANELNCVIGPNGAGKSTLLNMICGTLPVSSGKISFGSRYIQDLSIDAIARLGIARKFQVPTVFHSLTVLENIRVSASVKTDYQALEDILTTVRLADCRDTRASELPHGRKQWLEIGMALSMRPKVLLLDEPTAGLSSEETKATAAFLRRLQGKVTVVVVEHDMNFVRDLRARTIVLHQGSVIASGSFSEIEQNELVRDVYLGRR